MAKFSTLVRKGAETLPFWGRGGNSSGWMRWLAPGQSIDYEKEVGHAHLNSVVAIGVQAAHRMFVEAPPKIQRRGKDVDGKPVWEDVSGHWAEDLFDFPNEFYGIDTFWAGVLVGWLTHGTAYIFAPMGATGERLSLMVMPTFQVIPRSDKDNADGRLLVTHYEYRPIGGSKIDIPAELVICLKQGFDPIDPRQGMSALRAQFPYVYGDNEGAKYTAGLMRNFGVPSIMFSPKQTDTASGMVDYSDMLNFRDQIRESFNGEGAGRPGIVPFPAEMNRLGFSPKEMDLQALRSVPVDRICAALGFDPMTLGLPSDNKTYSNLGEAARGAWKRTIRPAKTAIGAQLTKAFFDRQSGGPGGFRVWWDFDSVPELSEDKDKLHARVREDFKADLISRHKALAQLGINAEGEDDVHYSEARGFGKAAQQPAAPVAPPGSGQGSKGFHIPFAQDELQHPY